MDLVHNFFPGLALFLGANVRSISPSTSILGNGGGFGDDKTSRGTLFVVGSHQVIGHVVQLVKRVLGVLTSAKWKLAEAERKIRSKFDFKRHSTRKKTYRPRVKGARTNRFLSSWPPIVNLLRISMDMVGFLFCFQSFSLIEDQICELRMNHHHIILWFHRRTGGTIGVL
jgi:hypothetical protein